MSTFAPSVRIVRLTKTSRECRLRSFECGRRSSQDLGAGRHRTHARLAGARCRGCPRSAEQSRDSSCDSRCRAAEPWMLTCEPAGRPFTRSCTMVPRTPRLVSSVAPFSQRMLNDFEIVGAFRYFAARTYRTSPAAAVLTAVTRSVKSVPGRFSWSTTQVLAGSSGAAPRSATKARADSLGERRMPREHTPPQVSREPVSPSRAAP